MALEAVGGSWRSFSYRLVGRPGSSGSPSDCRGLLPPARAGLQGIAGASRGLLEAPLVVPVAGDQQALARGRGRGYCRPRRNGGRAECFQTRHAHPEDPGPGWRLWPLPSVRLPWSRLPIHFPSHVLVAPPLPEGLEGLAGFNAASRASFCALRVSSSPRIRAASSPLA